MRDRWWGLHDGRLGHESPWEDDDLQPKVSHGKVVPEPLKVWSEEPLSLLQRLKEALVELHLEEVQEGTRQGRLPPSLQEKSCPGLGGLLNKAAYLVCGRMNGRVSKADVAKHPPGLKLFLRHLPAYDRLHPMRVQQEADVCEGGECAASQYGFPPPCQERGL